MIIIKEMTKELIQQEAHVNRKHSLYFYLCEFFGKVVTDPYATQNTITDEMLNIAEKPYKYSLT